MDVDTRHSSGAADTGKTVATFAITPYNPNPQTARGIEIVARIHRSSSGLLRAVIVEGTSPSGVGEFSRLARRRQEADRASAVDSGPAGPLVAKSTSRAQDGPTGPQAKKATSDRAPVVDSSPAMPLADKAVLRAKGVAVRAEQHLHQAVLTQGLGALVSCLLAGLDL